MNRHKRIVVPTNVAALMAGGGAPPYTASAVDFFTNQPQYDNGAFGLGAGATAVSTSFWINLGALGGIMSAQTLLDTDPNGSESTIVEINTADGATDEVFMTYDLLNTGQTGGVNLQTSNFDLSAGGWAHFLGSLSSDAGNNAIGAFYLTDVLDTGVTLRALGSPPFTPVYGNGLDWKFGNKGDSSAPMSGYFADFWMSATSLLDGTGLAIPTATRRQFISGTGQPQNPSGFPPGLILFSGNATNFATNQGSGGAFTLTAGGPLLNAPSHP